MNYVRYRWGELKARIAAMPVGAAICVPAYRRASRPTPRPSPKAREYARLYGYVLEPVGYAELGGKPIAFLRRTA